MSFNQAKIFFDKQYSQSLQYEKSLVPVHIAHKENISLKNKKWERSEEYYKWQFVESVVVCGLYNKDYIGVEVQIPKWNPSSTPIRMDAVIFDDKSWFQHYRDFWVNKTQEDLDWLTKHIVAIIEFKKEEWNNREKYINQQLKSAMKISEQDFVIGMYYDSERLWIFQQKWKLFLRYDETYNIKGDESGIKDLCLDQTDAYYNIPSFEDIISRTDRTKQLDRSSRRLDDLFVISWVHAKSLNDSMNEITRTFDKQGLWKEKSYELLIQSLALKIFDEKQTEKLLARNLQFYITEREKWWQKLGDEEIQSFIERMENLHKKASEEYYTILEQSINWRDEKVVRSIITIVDKLQDFSFIKSAKTNLYQLVFYKFANAFNKSEKGQFVTPIQLIDFLVEMVNPRAGETVIDPCVGIADFLSISYVSSQSKLDDNNLYGTDIDGQMIMLAQLNMLLNGDGNAKLYAITGNHGALWYKFDTKWKMVQLNPIHHANGNRDNRPDHTRLKKFDVVLTNPPFGENRPFKINDTSDEKLAQCYELRNLAKMNDWIDMGVLFLENMVRILDTNGRFWIVVSNSIASVERREEARKWLLSQVRVVALFDLPANVFADTGVNTTMIIGYKPSPNELAKLQSSNYEIFVKDIQRVGYEVRTSKGIKFFNPLYEIDPETFETKLNEDGTLKLDEEFSETITEFRQRTNRQESTLIDLFCKSK